MAPVENQGLKSLIAVITLRRLLREEKQEAAAKPPLKINVITCFRVLINL